MRALRRSRALAYAVGDARDALRARSSAGDATASAARAFSNRCGNATARDILAHSSLAARGARARAMDSAVASVTSVRALASGAERSGRASEASEEESALQAARSGARYDEITDKWIPEKPVSAVEGASYGFVGLVGLAIAAAAVWFGVSELLLTPREHAAMDAAMDKLREDVRVSVALGTPMTSYGSESRNRGARRSVAHRVVLDERGKERLLVQFYARGSRGSAVVRAEAGLDEATGKWTDFQYIIVDVQGASPTRIHVVSPKASPQRLVAL